MQPPPPTPTCRRSAALYVGDGKRSWIRAQSTWARPAAAAEAERRRRLDAAATATLRAGADAQAPPRNPQC